MGAICKTEHIVTLYTVHSPPVCHAPSARVCVASLLRAVSTAKTWALNDSQSLNSENFKTYFFGLFSHKQLEAFAYGVKNTN